MLGSEYEYLTGVLTSFSGPQAGCSIAVTMLRASTSKNMRHHRSAQPLPSSKKNAQIALTMFMVHSSLNIIDGGVGHTAAL